MFRLEPRPTFMVEVPITQPGGGEPQVLRVHFKHQTTSQLEAFTSGGLSEEATLARMVDHIDPADADGLSTPEFLARLFENYPTARMDLLHVYMRELTESRVKNSNGQRRG